MDENDELYWSIANIIEFVKATGVETCDCDNCQAIRNSLAWCQQYVDNYKSERKMRLN